MSVFLFGNSRKNLETSLSVSWSLHANFGVHTLSLRCTRQFSWHYIDYAGYLRTAKRPTGERIDNTSEEIQTHICRLWAYCEYECHVWPAKQTPTVPLQWPDVTMCLVIVWQIIGRDGHMRRLWNFAQLFCVVSFFKRALRSVKNAAQTFTHFCGTVCVYICIPSWWSSFAYCVGSCGWFWLERCWVSRLTN